MDLVDMLKDEEIKLNKRLTGIRTAITALSPPRRGRWPGAILGPKQTASTVDVPEGKRVMSRATRLKISRTQRRLHRERMRAMKHKS